MSYFLDQLANGFSLGAIYSLIALGFAMVYSILRFLNFAHSEVFTTGAFSGYFALKYLGPDWGPWSRLALAALVAAMVAGTMAVLIERVAYRPLRELPPVTVLLSAIGVSILLQNLGLQLLSAHTRGYPALQLPVPPKALAIGVLLVSLGLIWLVVYRSSLGRCMRAVAEDRRTAQLMGIEPNRVFTQVFFFGGALAGIAGVVWGTVYGTVHPQMGFLPGLKAFIIAVLGSAGNLMGTFWVGLALGVTEAMVAAYLPSSYSGAREVLVLLLLLTVLVVKPNGLFEGGPELKV